MSADHGEIAWKVLRKTNEHFYLSNWIKLNTCVLTSDSNCWSSPTTRGEGPAAREGHSAALIGSKLFVFGGCGRSPDDMEETYFNDLYILDTSEMLFPVD
jgi:hypothetical protein